MFKIRGQHTVKGDLDLCASCKYAHRIKGQREETVTFCNQLMENNRITFAVSECNMYVHKYHPSIREMEQIAWQLRTDPRKKDRIGFMSPKEMREKGIDPHDE